MGRKCNSNRAWETGLCAEMEAGDHVQPQDPNCIQSNIAGQLPKSGSSYCAEPLPAADVRNALRVEQLHSVYWYIHFPLSRHFNAAERYSFTGSSISQQVQGHREWTPLMKLFKHLRQNKTKADVIWTYFHGYFGRSSLLCQMMTDS